MTVKANALDGNFVINFGPDDKGNIRKEETEIAKAVGNWMKINGAAEYGTHHSPLEKQDWGYSTAKDSLIYLSVFNQPLNGLLRVKVPKSKTKGMVTVISKANFLSTGEPAKIKGNGKLGTFYRDKSGSSYFDFIIPEKFRKSGIPFVIVIQLKEFDQKEAYQDALT